MTEETQGWIEHDNTRPEWARRRDVMVEIEWNDNGGRGVYPAFCIHGWENASILRYRIVPQGHVLSHPRAQEQSCTCHPDDNPPVPCARKYALSECKDAELASLRAQLEEMTHAVGLLTTLHGKLEIDATKPLEMAQAIHAHVTAELERLRKNTGNAALPGCGHRSSEASGPTSPSRKQDKPAVAHLLLRAPTIEPVKFGFGDAGKVR